MAFVTDANVVPLRTSNKKSSPPYLFNQALAKQIKINKKPKYKENDFTLVINNCNTSTECKNNELRTVIIHEMLHGLGFMSKPKVIKMTDNKNDNKIGEIIFTENDKYAFYTQTATSYNKKLMKITKTEEYENQLYNSKITNFIPFNIFDKYLVSLKTGDRIFKNIPFYYEELNKKCFPKGSFSLTLKDFTTSFIYDCVKNLSSETQIIVNRIIKDHYFDVNTLAIETYDGEKIPLQTLNGQYSYSNCVSHINNPIFNELYRRVEEYGPNSESVIDMFNLDTSFKEDYILKYYDDNYILYMSDEDDFTVEEMLKKLPNNKKHPLIGNGIVKIMATLGWTEKGRKRNNHIHYLDETINIPESQVFKYYYKRMYDIEELNDKTSK